MRACRAHEAGQGGGEGQVQVRGMHASQRTDEAQRKYPVRLVELGGVAAILAPTDPSKTRKSGPDAQIRDRPGQAARQLDIA